MGSWSGHGTAAVAVALVSWLCFAAAGVGAIGANWGTQASHPLPPDTVVQMLKDNGFQKVKLFDAEDGTMNALKKSGLEVMVGIPNDLLLTMATSMKAAEKWVDKNVSNFLNDGVNIRYVAVGNEPFLETYNGSFLQTTFPAIRNIQSALIKAGLGNQVKVTCPLNADVYQSSTIKPSDGDFRTDIYDLMLTIVKFLSDNGGVFTVNIYPFISLYSDPNFPVDYAFFEGASSPIVDGSVTYTNMFDANHDTLVWALKKNGFGNLPIIVGEIGWPTDGDMNANAQLAQRFNQGFMTHIASGRGTPMRPGPVDAYLFSLIDEDEKSIQPGNFERHWGIFTYDGLPKYQLNMGTANSRGLVRAKNVKYLEKKWCVLKPTISLSDSRISDSVSYACSLADCTSLGYKTSCGLLDIRGNVSYTFNSYYQKNDQDDVACGFSNLATTTGQDPSTGTCRFGIMIEVDSAFSWRLQRFRSDCLLMLLLLLLQLCLSFS
ncbi:glucan endo-1,3-beta-glucosidase 6-like [Phragmites australis]|uniref:glucan endo-1,3-beta-glucosidase 6-like n=1 Tax=Phragmites australis TaxID=29695 RepID=UPI002D799634|nr:glucan endo-1,3-beta-glucosidase 6-like [Phragmites australis]XP_062218171.1 glucan endo-1,3-beta-glucosidase 6-like [Phragmites australis]XP_062218172.1 glucan endo-1,3-beta-glucosidase 6-like [Phragmites australis]